MIPAPEAAGAGGGGAAAPGLAALGAGPKHLDEASWYVLARGWVPAEAAGALYAALDAAHAWEQRPIVAFGREIPQPRLMDWAGEVPYRYSGQVLEPRPWDPALAALRERLATLCGVPFNHAILNLYRDGRDSVAMHADNEPELGWLPVIASLSLGASRRFVLAHRKNRRRKRTLHLHDGDLLVMGGATQRRWRHGVPRDAGIEAPRINVTLRWLLGPPAWREPGRWAPPEG